MTGLVAIGMIVLGAGEAVAQSTVRPLGVVVFPPFFDDDLRRFVSLVRHL